MVLCAIAAAILILSTILLWGSSLKDGSIFGPTVATWVEAIGSIAAVTAAAMIAGFQSRQLRLREALRSRQLSQACAHVAQEAAALARRSVWTDDLQTHIEDLANLLHLLAGKALETGDHALQLIRLERALHGFANALRSESGSGQREAELMKASKLLRATADELRPKLTKREHLHTAGKVASEGKGNVFDVVGGEGIEPPTRSV